ncbi:fatty acid desaturase family protein [Salinactinospora qingdaonensis]|uniref:Acyl-CoA desaturase n=1 Tax=Salinactinospora qingdaonensis TaxID=702744 RepID=A0ABP7FUS2_9ACTN
MSQGTAKWSTPSESTRRLASQEEAAETFVDHSDGGLVAVSPKEDQGVSAPLDQDPIGSRTEEPRRSVPGRPSATRRGSDYAVLSREVQAAGLLNRRPASYAVRIGVNLLLMAAGWGAFALIGPSWWQMLTGALLAVLTTQTAFIGHDAGHQQISDSKRVNNLIGRLHGNLLVGLSYSWWLSKHNRHHAHPNQVGRDPDIGGNAIAFTEEQTRARKGLGVWLARSQAWLFFPMLLLEGINLHVAGVRALFGRATATRGTKLVEAGLLLAHFGGYLTIVFLVLSPLQAVCFIAVHQGIFGLYMGCSFAPNHKGMPVFAKGDKVDFLRRQVLTSRNIRGGRLTDLALGGLNYQVEHHLFPSMPRPALPRVQPLVRAFCARHGITYHETGLLNSYAQVLGHLHTVGARLRPELEY